MPNPDSTVEGTLTALKTFLDIDERERFREAATILVKNRHEMSNMQCGLEDEGNSERKSRAIKELLK